jgi:hypothetical protein
VANGEPFATVLVACRQPKVERGTTIAYLNSLSRTGMQDRRSPKARFEIDLCARQRCGVLSHRRSVWRNRDQRRS